MILTILLRSVLVGALIALWFATQKLIGNKEEASRDIVDVVHRWMTPWHKRLLERESLRRTLLITSSIGVDLLGLSVLGLGILGQSFAPILGLFLILILRQSCQMMTTLPTPEGMIWEDPGVPSVFVTYGVTNDLFFSGHTAIAVYGGLVLASLGIPWLTAAALALALFEIVAVLALRAHWTLDVYTGAVSAALAFMLVH